MKNNAIKNTLKLSLVIAVTMLLSGCNPFDWVKEKFSGSEEAPIMMENEDDMLENEDDMIEKKTTKSMNAAESDDGDDMMQHEDDIHDNSESIVTLDGKPVVTMQAVEEEIASLIEEQPEIKALLPMIPDLKMQVAKGLTMQAVVDEWVKRNADNDYRKKLQRVVKQTKRMFDHQWFNAQHPVSISDMQVKDFYDNNKNKMVELMVSRGGINGSGIAFDSSEKAEDFLSHLGDQDLAMAAHDMSPEMNVEEFTAVGPHSSDIDPMVRNAFLSMKNFPENKVVESAGKYWVLQGHSNEEEKYQAFEEVKDMIRPMVEKEEQKNQIESLVKKYENQYNLKINDDLMNSLRSTPQGMPQGMPGMEHMMEDEDEMMNDDHKEMPNMEHMMEDDMHQPTVGA